MASMSISRPHYDATSSSGGGRGGAERGPTRFFFIGWLRLYKDLIFMLYTLLAHVTSVPRFIYTRM